MNQPLIFALARGRLLDETVPLLTELGIEPTESLIGSRKLMFETENPEVKLLFYEQPMFHRMWSGVGASGIAGKDVLLEYGSDKLCEPVDLKLSKCRLMTAMKKGIDLPATVGSEWQQSMSMLRVDISLRRGAKSIRLN